MLERLTIAGRAARRPLRRVLSGIWLLSIAHAITAVAQQAPADSAENLFIAGRFDEAARAFEARWAEHSADYWAAYRLGTLALYANKLQRAEEWLRRAIALQPDSAAPKLLLAERYYRADRFEQAAELQRQAGRTAGADKLASFAGVTPYEIVGPDEVTLPFVQLDPLPVAPVRVNGSDTVFFLIDTGASEVYLDTEFATERGVRRFGSERGTFGGDRQADVEQGRIDSLGLGPLVVRHLPVHILPTRRFSAAGGGRRIDGILGTNLFYHFLTTLDYPGRALVLRRRTGERSRALQAEARAAGDIVIPFWLAGSHYTVAWGRLNESEPLLWFVDTGLAGGAVTIPESTVKAAGIQLMDAMAREGQGGGGAVPVVPFIANVITLGDARRENLMGFYGPFPASLERAFGFRIGGIISHTFFKAFAVTFDFDAMRIVLATP